MESSNSNSEEMELQQMQLNERELHQKCLTWFTKLNIHRETLHNSFHYTKTRSFGIAFRIFFLEEYETFKDKMNHNLNQLQRVTASDFHNRSWQESFTEGMRCKPDKFRSLVLLYLEELDKIIDERCIALNDNTGVTESSVTVSVSSSPWNENKSSDHKSTSSGNDADTYIGPSYNSDTVTEVNENNSNVIFDVPNRNPDRNKEEHDDRSYEQQRAFFASLINNLKCDVEKYNEVIRQAQ
ncbi:hypothetical protein Tco_0487433 [Tanacetum coccineum]